MNRETVFYQEPLVDVKPLNDILRRGAENFKKLSVLVAAVDAGIFDALHTPQSASDLADSLGIDSAIASDTCLILKTLGLLEDENGLYKNTAVSSVYLRSDSPLQQKNVLQNLQNSCKLWGNLPEILKNGPVETCADAFFMDNLIHSLAEEALCGELQRTVNIIASQPEFAAAGKLLDLGGGHGLYAIAFTRLNPNLQAYVYDLPNVVEDTKQYIAKHGAERVEVIAGNFFQDELGGEYDIIFFASNPGGKNPGLIPKIYAGLKSGGILINKHCFYHGAEDSKNPLLDMEWKLTALAGVNKGRRVYSFQDDLYWDQYLRLLERYFTIRKVIDAPEFKGHQLCKIGDTLDAKIIVAKKR